METAKDRIVERDEVVEVERKGSRLYILDVIVDFYKKGMVKFNAFLDCFDDCDDNCTCSKHKGKKR